MRASLPLALVLAITGAGCFGGGCFPDGYRLVWEQPDLVPIVAARATPQAIANRSVTIESAGSGLPFDSANLPAQDGNASLRWVSMSWGGTWPGEAQLRVLRDGNFSVTGKYDTGDRKETVRSHFIAFFAAISDAPAEERELRVNELLANWNPRSNDIVAYEYVDAPNSLRLDALFVEQGGAWTLESPGAWLAGNGQWRFEAKVAVWNLNLVFSEESVRVDAAGGVAGPVLDVDDPAKRPPADTGALHNLTMARFADLDLPEPDLSQADSIVARRICID